MHAKSLATQQATQRLQVGAQGSHGQHQQGFKLASAKFTSNGKNNEKIKDSLMHVIELDQGHSQEILARREQNQRKNGRSGILDCDNGGLQIKEKGRLSDSLSHIEVWNSQFLLVIQLNGNTIKQNQEFQGLMSINIYFYDQKDPRKFRKLTKSYLQRKDQSILFPNQIKSIKELKQIFEYNDNYQIDIQNNRITIRYYLVFLGFLKQIRRNILLQESELGQDKRKLLQVNFLQKRVQYLNNFLQVKKNQHKEPQRQLHKNKQVLKPNQVTQTNKYRISEEKPRNQVNNIKEEQSQQQTPKKKPKFLNKKQEKDKSTIKKSKQKQTNKSKTYKQNSKKTPRHRPSRINKSNEKKEIMIIQRRRPRQTPDIESKLRKRKNMQIEQIPSYENSSNDEQEKHKEEIQRAQVYNDRMKKKYNLLAAKNAQISPFKVKVRQSEQQAISASSNDKSLVKKKRRVKKK